jgi:hypothetical protein
MELEVSAMVATVLNSAIDSNPRRLADGLSSHGERQALFATPADVLERDARHRYGAGTAMRD